MKIFGAYRGDASSYYRITAPFSVLRYRTKHEFVVSRLSMEAVMDCDVLWLQQHASATAEVVARDFKAAGGRIIYDVDDWLFDIPPSWPCYDDYYRRGTGIPTERLLFHERLLNLADVVTTTTDYLAGKLRERLGPGKRVIVLPNCILQGDWDTVIPASHGLDGPVLGWFGTENHWDDWAEIVDVVDNALETVGGYLALIGAPELVTMFSDRLAERTMVHPLVPWNRFDEARRLIAAFDVGLAWCSDRFEVNRCRSPLKAIQYGAAGVPVVASDTVYGDMFESTSLSPSRSHIRNHGMIAQGTETLRIALTEALAYARPAAQMMALEWRQEVWHSHSYESQATQWLDVCLEVVDGPAGD